MQETISLFILVAGAILAALATTTVMAGTVQMTSRLSHGYLHLIFYAMVVMVALTWVFAIFLRRLARRVSGWFGAGQPST